ncbi:MAG: DNA-binding domain-containing protein [Candidatus Thiothrix sulfatifontis]|nr:MAG: DNA-binding domain-containing protein [Candidatus Thiothrix sulfatifontis]
MPELQQIQAWMITALANPVGLNQGLTHATLRHDLLANDIIRGDYQGRLSIYFNSYSLRLLQCLEADFPALKNVMGKELFDFFALTYILNHPSQSTTLFDLGASFADFLGQTQTKDNTMPFEWDTHLQLPLDLARLERKRTEVMRERGLEHTQSIYFIEPHNYLQQSDIILVTPPCLRLLELSFPLIPFLQAIDKGDASPAIPLPQESFVAITRLNFQVSLYTLQPWQYHFLMTLQKTPDIHQNIDIIAQITGFSANSLQDALIYWLPIAVETGLIHPTRSLEKTW